MNDDEAVHDEFDECIAYGFWPVSGLDGCINYIAIMLQLKIKDNGVPRDRPTSILNAQTMVRDNLIENKTSDSTHEFTFTLK